MVSAGLTKPPPQALGLLRAADVKAAPRTAQMAIPVPADVPLQLVTGVEALLLDQAFRQA